MLVLFPFEEEIYRKEGIPVTYVGHPLAGAVPMQPDRAAARARLGIDQNARVLAILPGSRSSEIRLLAPRFLQAAQILQKRDPALLCIVPMVNEQRRAEFQSFLEQYPVPGLRCVTAQDLHGEGGERQAPVAWSVMEASTAVLVASGTATLETALYKRPMVISYVLSPWMRRIMAWKSGQNAPICPGSDCLTCCCATRGAGAAAGRRHAGKAGRGDLDGSDRRARARASRRASRRCTRTCCATRRAGRARHPRGRRRCSLTFRGHAPARADHRRRGRGRPGPLAGAVYAAAVILDPARPIEGLADSKALAGAARSAGAGDRERALAWFIASASVQEIDSLNILRATMLAMQRAVQGLSVAPQLALVDGNQAPAGLHGADRDQGRRPGAGDLGRVHPGKTACDADPLRLHEQYPQYAFDQHKGYGTALHLRCCASMAPAPNIGAACAHQAFGADA